MERTKNIRWKTPLPGLGHSSPVVWGNRIYLSSARAIGDKFEPRPDIAPGAHDNKLVDSKYEFLALAIDRQSGEIVWERSLVQAIPHEGAHVTGSLASQSPVTDGEHIFFHFGSFGTFCLSPEGKTIWKKNLGVMNTKHGHGEGSSPVLHENILVINWDHEKQSFIVAMDKKTGKELWKKKRDELTSWSSPIVATPDQKPQVIVAATGRIRGYDLKSGALIWSCRGLSKNVCATPAYENGMLYAGSSYDTRNVMGINIRGAQGDITTSNRVVWQRKDRPPYVPSLLLVDNGLYYLRHYQGILTRLDAPTGKEPSGPFRLGSMHEIYSSPVSADGRIYITDRRGHTAVITTGREAKQIAYNRLNDRISATAALVGKQIFLRGESYLYCIEKE